MEGSVALLNPVAVPRAIAMLHHLALGRIRPHGRDGLDWLDGAIVVIGRRGQRNVGSVTHLDFTLPRVIAKCGGRGQLAEDEAQQEQA